MIALACVDGKAGMNVLICEKVKPGMNVLTCEKEGWYERADM